MKAEKAYFHCGDHLKLTLANAIGEIDSIVASVEWAPTFRYCEDNMTYEHQAGYNKAFAREFTRFGWESQPQLRVDPRLIGDFRKGLVFVEIQFGNSSALSRLL